MGNAKSFMMLAAVFFLFIGACTYAAEVVHAIDGGTRLLYRVNENNDSKVKAKLDAPGSEVYSAAQIVCMIRNIEELDADIEVDGLLYSRSMDYEELNPALVDSSKIYRAVYMRDISGYLIKIVFRG